MPDGFVPLAASLRAPPAPARTEPAPTAQVARANDGAIDETAHPLAEFAGDLALARLAALEAYERAVPRLLDALAREVLGRELVSAPPDVAAVARALAAEFSAEEPVAFAVAREDLARFPAGIPARVDPRLRAGDVVLDVRDGEIDARFALRVRAAVARATQ